MTKTLEEVIFEAHHGLWSEDAKDIAQAVREWMLSDENVERLVQDLDRHPFMVAQHRLRDARAALEAVIGRTDTHSASCTGSRSVGVGHGRSGDGDPAPSELRVSDFVWDRVVGISVWLASKDGLCLRVAGNHEDREYGYAAYWWRGTFEDYPNGSRFIGKFGRPEDAMIAAVSFAISELRAPSTVQKGE
jgi:hypothetical protein